MGYHPGQGGVKFGVRIKKKIKPQKCFFCSEKRLEMLEVYRKKGVKGDKVKTEDVILLCPNHLREVQLGIKLI